MHPFAMSAGRRSSVAAAFLFLFVGAAAIAQTRPIAYPQGARSGSRGNWGPLGEVCSANNPNGAVSKARTQILVPAEYLPPRPSVVWALDHIPVWLTSGQYPCTNTGSTVTYADLEIRLAHRARNSGPLSLNFDVNLPSPLPAPVFAATNWTKAWTLGTWNSIQFASPFAYDGVSDMVVEIRKVVTPSDQNVGSLRNLDPVRAGLPRQVMAIGDANSSANVAASGVYTNPLGWRLRFDNAPEPTLEVRCVEGANGHFTNGTPNSHFRVFDSAGDLFVIAASFQFLPVAIPVPPARGGLWLDLQFVPISPLGVVTPATGTSYHRQVWPIPSGAWLAGLRICAQAVTLDPAAGVPDLTNAVDFIIR